MGKYPRRRFLQGVLGIALVPHLKIAKSLPRCREVVEHTYIGKLTDITFCSMDSLPIPIVHHDFGCVAILDQCVQFKDFEHIVSNYKLRIPSSVEFPREYHHV